MHLLEQIGLHAENLQMETVLLRNICECLRQKEKEKRKVRKMSNSVGDGGAAGPYLDNIEIREGDEEQLLDIVSLGEKVFMSSWNEQMVATSMYGTYDTVLTAVDTSKGNKVVGYCIFTAPCEDCELLRIAVDKEYRKHGIGSRMMKEMIRLCTEDDGEKNFPGSPGIK